MDYINFNTALYDTIVYHLYNVNGITNIAVVLEKNTVMECTSHLKVGLFNVCDTVGGETFYDLNQNCSFDSNDYKLSNQTIVLKDSLDNSIGIGVSDTSGYYNVIIPSNYSSYYLLKQPANYTNKVYCPDSAIRRLDTASNISKSFSFSERCDTSLNNIDLCVKLNQQRVGTPDDIGHLTFSTNGLFNCNVDSVFIEVELSHSSLLNFNAVTSSIPADSIVDTTIYWSYFQKRNLTVRHTINYITNTSATLFDSVLVTIKVDSNASEVNFSNNHTARKTRVLTSWDPNNKVADPQGIGPNRLVEKDLKMNYTINFQNLGTAPAKNIYILDTIDSNLDIGTFNFISSSHAVDIQNPASHILRFDFNDINLMDIATNEELSKGFINYSIDRMPNLEIGSIIENHEQGIRNTSTQLDLSGLADGSYRVLVIAGDDFKESSLIKN